jgi:hypothetical protein
MKSRITLEIDWTKPNIKDEAGEYLENTYTINFFKRKYKLVLSNEKEVLSFLSYGSMKKLDRPSLLRSTCSNMTTTRKDFESELRDVWYRKSYDSMYDKLIQNGKISLPSPIIIKFPSLYYGFAGNRRTNLAYNLNMDVVFWIVDYSKYLKAIK